MSFKTEERSIRLWRARMAIGALVCLFTVNATLSSAFAQPSLRLALLPVDLKLLVLTGTGTEPSFLAIDSFLNQIGIPHDDVILAPPGGAAVPLPALNNASKGFYEGIILSSGEARRLRCDRRLRQRASGRRLDCIGYLCGDLRSSHSQLLHISQSQVWNVLYERRQYVNHANQPNLCSRREHRVSVS